MRRKGETLKQKQDPVVPRGQCLSIRNDDKQRNEKENKSIYLGNTLESWKVRLFNLAERFGKRCAVID